MSRLLTFLFILLMWAAPLPVTQAQDLKPVSFIPQWVPQAQFAGYYVAYEKGFYRERHLDVKILRGGPDFPPSELLKTGQVDFGTMFLTTGIANRAKGFKLINVAQIVQRSALMLVAKKSSGITAPEDLQGKKVGLWGAEFQILPRAFFQQYRLAVKTIPQGATINLFLRGGVDAASAMWYNEYHQIIAAGLNPEELTTFLLSDYGLKFPEDGIYCLEETFKKDPDRCVAFVQATIQGWKYAFAHPDEALDIVMKYVTAANVATNRVHQRWMLERMQDIIQPPGAHLPLGSLEQETYYQVATELKNNGLIQQIPDFSRFFINCESEHEK
ncbi:MAG: ABC transporter substrate-binding protein [Deltaproteobacteria bacterium RBG_13_58_19]|nr:MAG: ABC transporter substrate-binding protein [Deltaproteobacteria bacterium RBG_13_58_19]